MTMPCPALNSGYKGDELCILPPDPELGIQLHVGPTDYTDPEQLREFELGPGEEITRCYYFTAPNTETFNFYEQHYRMRPGSHHLIMHQNTTNATRANGWDLCELPDLGSFMPIGGTQRSSAEFPIDGVTPPEDEGLFRPLVPNALMKFELHFVNSSPTETILREAWVNLKRKDDGDQILGGVFMIGRGIVVEPHTTEIMNYKCTAGEPKRVVSLFGHRHAHTPRFTVWATRGGVREQIYEDYSWEEPIELSYNSILQNPAPDPVAQTPGGSSGILNFDVGDTIEWECQIENTSDQTLRIRNEVYTGEMCNLFGSATGGAPFWFCGSAPTTAP